MIKIKMINKISWLLTFCFFLLFSVSPFAQQLASLPLDSKVRHGELDNGLTYYIQHNETPKNRADFYIVQNVGAILENDNQDGLAHFLEHMAFNGTKNFPKKGILNYFEKIGVRFGDNINAYTSLDETVYNLSDVPTIREGVVDTALLVLHDWSGFLSLEEEEIDAERGVILEEWRTRQGASRRLWKEINKLKFPGSQYAKRDVIGDTAIILNFKYQELRDYYQKWYRPDLQAIIIVGDVDVDVIEEKIKTLFKDIPKRKTEHERPIYTVKDNEQPIVAIVSDPEARMTRFEIQYKHEKMPAELKNSVNGYLVSTINNLIRLMLRSRFNEMTEQASAPFVSAGAGYGELIKSKDAFTMVTIPHEGREAEGFEALVLEAEKLKRFGFTNSELERAKINLLKGTEKKYNEREHQKNNSFVKKYISHFLNSTPTPGIEWEYESLKIMLPQLRVDMINQIAESYIIDENVIVSVSAPKKDGLSLPTEEDILLILDKAKDAKLTAREEESLDAKLIETPPVPGKIKSVRKNKSLGITEWFLSNGLKVLFKPTTFKKDEIQMTAFSQGGLSMVDRVEDLPTASLATTIIAKNGLDKYNRVDLDKLLTGKVANVSPFISDYSEGFNGVSSVSDFETLLQLVYLYFSAPRLDDNSFEAMKNVFRVYFTNKGKDPNEAFSDTLKLVSTNYHPRTVLFDLESIDKLDQKRALEIYKERFGLPEDFTFVFVGNINPEDENVKNMICTYLGGVKSRREDVAFFNSLKEVRVKKTNVEKGVWPYLSGLKIGREKEKYIDRGIRYPEGMVSKSFERKMETQKATNCFIYSAQIPYNLKNSLLMSALSEILTLRYTESVREKEGGSYGVGVSGSLSKEPIEQATLYIGFDTDPEKQESLIKIIYDEIKEIVAYGPRPEDLKKVKENFLKNYHENIEENWWWKSALVRYYEDGINLPKQYKQTVDDLTVSDIRTLAREIIDQGNRIELVMRPEKK